MEETFKVVLLGETGVGKTSIISQFVDQNFQEDIQPSTGGTFSSKTFIYENNKLLKFEIWDTAGQERYRSLTTMFYKEANAAILVYDITRVNTFDEIKTYWAKQIKESAPENIILVICANKSDLIKEEKVDEEMVRKFAQDIGAIFCSTSAKNSFGISDLFLQIAKKYTKCDDIRIKNDDEEIAPQEEDDRDVNMIKRGSVKITNNNNNKKEDKKKKCC